MIFFTTNVSSFWLDFSNTVYYTEYNLAVAKTTKEVIFVKKVFEKVKYNPLFQEIAFSDFERMLNCLAAKTATYKKNEIIILSGDKIDFIGLVVSGSVKIIKEDIDGNITMLGGIGASEIFGECFVCAGVSRSSVTIQASKETEVLFINYRKIMTVCATTCVFHGQLVENMVKLIARKNLLLNQKIEVLSRRTTRDKLLCFFDTQRGLSKKFVIPFNREELAHYLGVNRSAMSKELGKMRDEGLIKFQKNVFEIL